MTTGAREISQHEACRQQNTRRSSFAISGSLDHRERTTVCIENALLVVFHFAARDPVSLYVDRVSGVHVAVFLPIF